MGRQYALNDSSVVVVVGSGAAANPTLTIVALAIRQADHIAERMVRNAL